MEKDNICGSDIYCSTSVVNAYLRYEQDVIIRASEKRTGFRFFQTMFIGYLSWPCDYQKWLTRNLSPLYPYIIQQKDNENTQTYQVEVVILI